MSTPRDLLAGITLSGEPQDVPVTGFQLLLLHRFAVCDPATCPWCLRSEGADVNQQHGDGIEPDHLGAPLGRLGPVDERGRQPEHDEPDEGE